MVTAWDHLRARGYGFRRPPSSSGSGLKAATSIIFGEYRTGTRGGTYAAVFFFLTANYDPINTSSTLLLQYRTAV